MVALGFVMERGAYLRDMWNWLDFVVVVVGWLTLSGATSSGASALRSIRVLRPLLGLIFGETRRRRRAATLLLQARGLGAFGRVRYGWSLRRAGGRCGPLRAASRSLGVLSQDAAAALISLPVQLLFKIVFTTIRLVRRAKQALGMTPPKMPPLTTA